MVCKAVASKNDCKTLAGGKTPTDIDLSYAPPGCIWDIEYYTTGGNKNIQWNPPHEDKTCCDNGKRINTTVQLPNAVSSRTLPRVPHTPPLLRGRCARGWWGGGWVGKARASSASSRHDNFPVCHPHPLDTTTLNFIF